jgi:hypothetical protein
LDVLPADVPAQYAPAMVAACSEALAEGSCALASTLPESTRPEAVALVLWQGDGYLQVTVRVGRGGGQWVARALTFSERDSISERWTTVGLTVATLVGESRVLEPNPPSQPASSPTATPSQQPAVAASPSKSSATSKPPATRPAQGKERSGQWLASTGLLLGAGWDGGGLQRGGWLAVTYRAPRWPVQAHAFGSYALSDGPTLQGHEVGARWVSGGVGAGVFGTFRPLSVTGSAELQLSYRHIDVDFNGGSASDQELPVRLRMVASVPASGAVAGTLGALLSSPAKTGSENSGLAIQGAAVPWEVVAGLEVRL